MTGDYFDDVERGLRAAVRRRAHLPWYLRLRPRYRGALAIAVAALVAAGPALAAAGVFESGLQVTSSTCSASGGSADAGPTAACTFALSDGRRFACPESMALTHPSAGDVVRARSCSRLPPATGTPAGNAAVARVRHCLAVRRLRSRGGPAPSSGAREGSGPDGELVVGDAGTGAIAAFYPSARVARQLERGVRQRARRFGGQVERRGAVTVVWTRSPASAVRAAVRHCLPR